LLGKIEVFWLLAHAKNKELSQVETVIEAYRIATASSPTEKFNEFMPS
jgi:hypothetical protein